MFPVLKIDVFSRRGGGYCSIHQSKVCMFKLGTLTSFNVYLVDQFHVKFKHTEMLNLYLTRRLEKECKKSYNAVY